MFRDKFAYTLIELMVVLVLIGLAAGLIVVKTGVIARDSQLDNFCKQLVLKLQQEHNKAVASGHKIVLTFTQDTLTCEADAKVNCFAAVKLPEHFHWSWAPKNKKDEKKLRLVFSSDGESSSFTLYVSARGNKQIEIIGMSNGTILMHEL